jgi:hydrogenase maturation protease
MNRAVIDRIANAALYEGYILYPYRPSLKNRQRWTFGGLYPEAYCQAQGGEAASLHTECLIHGGLATAVEAVVRFLHLTARQAGEVDQPPEEWPNETEPPFRPVEALNVGGRLWHTWQEAQEREVSLGKRTVADLLTEPCRLPFAFPADRRWEAVRGPAGELAGVLVRQQQAVAGVIKATAAEVAPELFRLTLRVDNTTPLQEAGSASRDEALLRSLVSTHVLLGVERGEFVSLLDPPECWREAAAGCCNRGVWPVLVGEAGQKETMLSSPIILYDYPQVATESPGDFFDGTEIDEMLTLRILTLTDEEKQAMAAVDERARLLLTRTEGMAQEQILRLHGASRSVPHLAQEDRHG